jgi:hypothetical protein
MTTIDLGIARDSASIIAETPKAFRVLVPHGGGFSVRNGRAAYGSTRPVWIPKSTVSWRACQGGMAETMHVPAWLARKL